MNRVEAARLKWLSKLAPRPKPVMPLTRVQHSSSLPSREADLERDRNNIMVRIPSAPVISQEMFFGLFGQGLAAPYPEFPEGCPTDRQCILALARTFRPKRVLELGIRWGATAFLLLRECPWIEEYWGVDCEPTYQMGIGSQQVEHPDVIPRGGDWHNLPPRDQITYTENPQAGRWVLGEPRFKLHVLPRGTQDLDPATCGQFDMIFIDDDHSLRGVWTATKLSRQIVKKPGVILWHDYKPGTENGIPQVVDFLNRRERSHIHRVAGTHLVFELAKPDSHIAGLRDWRVLDVPDSPRQFNSSIVDCGGGYLVAMRREYDLPGSIGFAFLDSELQLVGPQGLPRWANGEDPRIVRVADSNRYYTLHSCLVDGILRRQVVTEIEAEYTKSLRSIRRAMLNGLGMQPFEKNWTPFIYEGRLLISYSLNPHVVMEVSDWSKGMVRRVHETTTSRWPLGLKVHGSTPSVFVPRLNAYMGLFHTSWQKIPHERRHFDAAAGAYSIGAYLFEAVPPFRMTHSSLRPLTFQDLYPPQLFDSARPYTVGTIFPAGLSICGEEVTLSYGENDLRTRIVRCDLKQLLDTVVPLYPTMSEDDSPDEGKGR